MLSDDTIPVAIPQSTPSATVNVKRRTLEEPKPSSTVKRLWHAACFAPRDRKGSGRKWKRFPAWMPLKTFVSKLVDPIGKTWLANRGS